jgi:hypothetical protein
MTPRGSRPSRGPFAQRLLSAARSSGAGLPPTGGRACALPESSSHVPRCPWSSVGEALHGKGLVGRPRPRLCEAHNSTVAGDRELAVNEVLQPREKQDVASGPHGRRRSAASRSRVWRIARPARPSNSIPAFVVARVCDCAAWRGSDVPGAAASTCPIRPPEVPGLSDGGRLAPGWADNGFSRVAITRPRRRSDDCIHG